MNHPRLHAPRPRATGLSLIELMVAMALGLLVSIGIVTLLGSTGQAHRVQNGLARLQENGRYVLSRVTSDLRMTSGQYCSNFGGGATTTANGSQMPLRAPTLHIADFKFPDASGAALPAGPLSPRHFIQGYDCAGASCTPANPPLPDSIPKAGRSAGDRVEGADVLTVRYQLGEGWLLKKCNARTRTLTVEGVPDIESGDAVLVSDCNTANIFRATVGNDGIAAPAGIPALCPASVDSVDGFIVEGEPRLFNFAKDFTTVTYYLKLRADANPDRAGRLVSVLVRRAPGDSGDMVEQEIAEGVERLDFLYAIEDRQGAVSFLNAGEVNASTQCPRPPGDVPMEAGCAWRSIKSIEVHVLLNTVDDLDIAAVDTAFRYSIDGAAISPPPVNLPNGLKAGKMMRREFVQLVTTRNFAN